MCRELNGTSNPIPPAYSTDYQAIPMTRSLTFVLLTFLALVPHRSMAQRSTRGASADEKVADVSRSSIDGPKHFLLLGAFAHLGNGEVIESSAISVRDGRFDWVADARLVRIDPSNFDTVYRVDGMHLYPGLIAAASAIGLREIGAVRATADDYEVGEYLPHVRSAIAFNTDSRVLPTLRNNGILMAQVAPQGGRISGTSSILHLDAWNWEDALIREDDALHMSWPQLMKRPGWWEENGRVEKNEDYESEADELYAYFEEARAYTRSAAPNPVNLAFEAMRPLFGGGSKVFIRCYEPKEIVEAVRFGRHFGLDIVLVDAGQAWQIADFLREQNVPVILEQVQRLPPYGHSAVDEPFRTPARLAEAGVRFGISVGSGWDAFWSSRSLAFHAGTAVAHGLDPESAVAALSGNIADILGISDRCGTIQSGLEATFLLSKGDLLDMRSSIVERAWIQGREVDLDDHQRQLYRQYLSKYGLTD